MTSGVWELFLNFSNRKQHTVDGRNPTKATCYVENPVETLNFLHLIVTGARHLPS